MAEPPASRGRDRGSPIQTASTSRVELRLFDQRTWGTEAVESLRGCLLRSVTALRSPLQVGGDRTPGHVEICDIEVASGLSSRRLLPGPSLGTA